MDNSQVIKNKRELEFVVFCVENVAAALGKPSCDVYRVLSGENGILHQYIIPSYDVLHTQGNTVRTYCYTTDAIAALIFILLQKLLAVGICLIHQRLDLVVNKVVFPHVKTASFMILIFFIIII